MKIYIQAAAHISNQEPYSDKWFDTPIVYNQRYIRSIEPDYTEFIAPTQARRMGKILKRALATALKTIQETGVENPEAIITGTGLGCIENTEKFLTAMIHNDEKFLPPTFFMQSTHNTISSLIAVHLKCHGYNSTYSHRGTSFDSALLDAFVQFQLGEIETAMVNGHDELTPDYFNMLEKIDYWKQGEVNETILRKADSQGSFAGECSISLMLGNTLSEKTLCQFRDIEMFYKPDEQQFGKILERFLNRNQLEMNDIDAVVVGINGDKENDEIYQNFGETFFDKNPLIWYKHIFGESYTVSGIGVYVAATILQRKTIPKHLLYKAGTKTEQIRNILVYNHFQNKDHSLILLSAC